MGNEERLIRINELAKKQRESGLSDEEKKEQDKLRKEYVKEFHNNLRGQLDRVKIQNPDGSVIDLKSIRKKHDK
ncbi:MAG: DUF896 domain-containing protein [Parasporobacterium sp.]|nr:DUF896 domain-containing protein [Parasporobacterium sp.]